MNKVYLLTGIIASGKSTWAKQHADSNTFIVSKDKIRDMIYGQYLYKITDEHLINAIAKAAVQSLLLNGANVIIDECWDTMTKGARERLEDWLKYIRPDCSVDVVYFSSVEGNVDRRLKDNHGNGSKEVWESVKQKMLIEFESPNEEEYSIKIDIGERNDAGGIL